MIRLVLLMKEKVVFKWDALTWRDMVAEEPVHMLRKQEYLDEVSALDLPASYATWYNVDVATLLTSTRIVGHEVDDETGQSLVCLLYTSPSPRDRG